MEINMLQDFSSADHGFSVGGMEARDQAFRQKLVGRLNLILGAIVMAAIALRASIFPTKPAVFPFTLIVTALFIASGLLSRRARFVSASAYVFLLNFAVLGFAAGVGNGGVRAPGVLSFVVLPLFGHILLGKRGGLVGLALAFIAVSGLLIMEKLGLVLPADAGMSGYIALVLSLGTVISHAIGALYESARKRNEALILRMAETLAQKSKLSSLGEMASGLAHEINNPLCIIIGRAEAIKRTIKARESKTVEGSKVAGGDEVIAKNVGDIIALSHRIAKIIKGLSTFSRDAVGDPFEATDVGALVSSTLSLCHERFRHADIELKVGDIPDVVLDCRATQISQILVNLLNNAFDAVEPLSERWAALDVDTDDRSIRFSISDAGNGVPAGVAEKLMEPFFTTKPVGRGTGLGLSIARGIAQSHGGSLVLDRGSRNTRFVLELPLRQEAPGELQQVEPAA